MVVRSLLILAVLVPSLASTAAAQVQDVEMSSATEVAARGHYMIGREHYDAGRFAEAASEFQVAYDLSHRSELLYNMFLAHRDAGHSREAAASLRQYLTEVPDAPEIEILRGRLAVLEAQIADEDARAAADAARAAETAETTDGTAPAPSSERSGGSVGPWVVLGVGGAIAIGAVVTGVLTATTFDDLSAHCRNGVCEPGYDVEGQRSTGSTLALTTDILGGIAGATLAAGIVWAIVDATSTGTGDAAAARVTCSPLGCGGRF